MSERKKSDTKKIIKKIIIGVVIGIILFVLVGNTAPWWWQYVKDGVRPKVTPTSSSYSYFPHSDDEYFEPQGCTYIKADGNIIGFGAIERQGWRNWEQNSMALSQAKKYKSPEALVHQIKNISHDFWRFGVESDANLYYSQTSRSHDIEFGPCWKRVQEIKGESIIRDGVEYVIEKQVIYVIQSPSSSNSSTLPSSTPTSVLTTQDRQQEPIPEPTSNPNSYIPDSCSAPQFAVNDTKGKGKYKWVFYSVSSEMGVSGDIISIYIQKLDRNEYQIFLHVRDTGISGLINWNCNNLLTEEKVNNFKLLIESSGGQFSPKGSDSIGYIFRSRFPGMPWGNY